MVVMVLPRSMLVPVVMMVVVARGFLFRLRVRADDDLGRVPDLLRGQPRAPVVVVVRLPVAAMRDHVASTGLGVCAARAPSAVAVSVMSDGRRSSVFPVKMSMRD